MLPEFENLDDLLLDFEEEEQSKTKTFGVNFVEGALETTSHATLGMARLGEFKLGRTIQYSTVGGMIDGLDALRQTITIMLSIEADRYIIYPHTYGLTMLDLIGKPIYYVVAVLPSRIKETLLTDDRIIDVSDFEFVVDRRKVKVTFVVHSIYGKINAETEVAYNV